MKDEGDKGDKGAGGLVRIITSAQTRLLTPFSFIGATFELLKLFAGKGFIIRSSAHPLIQNGMTSA